MPKIKKPDIKKARRKKGDKDLANTTEAQNHDQNLKE